MQTKNKMREKTGRRTFVKIDIELGKQSGNGSGVFRVEPDKFMRTKKLECGLRGLFMGLVMAIATAGLCRAEVAKTDAAPASISQAEKETVLPPSQSDAQAYGPLVKEIEVEYAGPKAVSKSVILSNMRTSVGQPYTKAGVEEDVRNLYATGLFVNLRIYDEPMADGVKVVVIVQPKPIIKEVVLSGWSSIKDKRLLNEVKTKVGETLNEKRVSEDAQKLTEHYQSKGFKDAQVTYKIDIKEETGRAVVTYNINEGVKRFIRAIQFVGNERFTSKRLVRGKKKLFDKTPDDIEGFKTKPRNWLSWLMGSGVVKDEQFQEDLHNLKRFYQSEGYIDMEVKGVEFRPVEEDKKVDVVITVSEGIQYKVGAVKFDGQKLYTEEKIRSRMRMLEGKVYSPQGLEKEIKAVKDLYGEQGYIDSRVQPARSPSIESGRMDLNYRIAEGSQCFVERIVIQGNNKTKDKVLRRELALTPGDVYNSIRADASKKRLENLDYFSKVDVSPQETNIPSRKNMVVTVEEKRTGAFTFGAGFSSIDSVLGFVEMSQSNFDIANWPSLCGAGQKMRIRAQYGAKRQDYTIAFVEPWFLNQRLSLGFDIFYKTASYLSSLYDETRYGFNVKLGKALTQFLAARAIYKFEMVSIENVAENTNRFILDEQGTRMRSAVEFGLTHDTRDSVFLTRRGHKVDLTTELVGLGGDIEIYKLGLEAQKFYLLPYDMIVSLQTSVGVVESYGSDERIPIFDRLYTGGANSIRGFRFRDIGPKDIDGTPIGGGTMNYNNAEMTFPIIERVRGAFFVDGGFVNRAAYDFTPDSFNLGTGFGLRLNLPIGPLRLDYGFPILTDEYNDRGGQFHFNVGYQF